MAHYRECKAVGWNVPDAEDDLVREHAALFRSFEDAAERARSTVQTQLMLRLAGEAKGKQSRG